MGFKKITDEQFNQLVATLQKTISFNTEKGTPAVNAPFGEEVNECLHYVLNLAESFGLSSYNCDGYAGHIDFKGTGDEVVGVLGHLDVVPSKAEEWKYPPYGGEIHDGKMYGRGTMDDKGPMIACLFAVKALKDEGFVPQKTVRLIFGCDEESNMDCVKHYFEKMPYPTVSFSPDGDFPVINREKGIYHFDVVCGKLPDGVKVTAGDRANVVPSLCVATLPNTTVAVTTELNNLTVKKTDTETVLTAVGKAAHGSTPDEGINATHSVLKTLAKIYPQNETLKFLTEKVCDTTGKAWGVNLQDKESGKLTCNLGVLRTADDGTLTATIDIRFPVTYNCDFMYDLLCKNTPKEFTVAPKHISNPLFVPSDSELVKTLMSVYNSVTKSKLEPIAIGGGTYSRCLPNCVAFGPLFPKEEQTIHMPNECVDLKNLRLMTDIYMEAIYRLAK